MTLDPHRLEEWKRLHRNRRKSAVSATSAHSNGSAAADLLTAPKISEGRRPSMICESGGVPRIYRAKSHQGPERLELPSNQGRIQRAYSQCGEVPITLPPLKSPHGI